MKGIDYQFKKATTFFLEGPIIIQLLIVGTNKNILRNILKQFIFTFKKNNSFKKPTKLKVRRIVLKLYSELTNKVWYGADQ